MNNWIVKNYDIYIDCDNINTDNRDDDHENDWQYYLSNYLLISDCIITYRVGHILLLLSLYKNNSIFYRT